MSKASKFVKEVTAKSSKPKTRSITVRVSEDVGQQYDVLKKLMKDNADLVEVDLNGCFALSVAKDIRDVDEAVKLKVEQVESTKGKTEVLAIDRS